MSSYLQSIDQMSINYLKLNVTQEAPRSFIAVIPFFTCFELVKTLPAFGMLMALRMNFPTMSRRHPEESA